MTDDMALRLDKDACFWPLVDLVPDLVPVDDDGEKQPGLEALFVLPAIGSSHRLIDTWIWPCHQPPFVAVATRPWA